MSESLRCPRGKIPFFINGRRESPLFVAPSMLEAARAASPSLWIEPTPVLPTPPDHSR